MGLRARPRDKPRLAHAGAHTWNHGGLQYGRRPREAQRGPDSPSATSPGRTSRAWAVVPAARRSWLLATSSCGRPFVGGGPGSEQFVQSSPSGFAFPIAQFGSTGVCDDGCEIGVGQLDQQPSGRRDGPVSRVAARGSPRRPSAAAVARERLARTSSITVRVEFQARENRRVCCLLQPSRGITVVLSK